MPGVIPIVGGASLLYVLLAPRLNHLVYRPLMFFPVSYPENISEVPDNAGVSGKEVYFEGGMGQKLHGWYWENPGAKFTFLFSHGNAGNLTIRIDTCRHLIESGCSVFVYDYQGFGKSSGKPTVEGICSDAVAAYDYLVNEIGCSHKNVLLYGESLGVAVSTHLSTARECSGLILQSGFYSLQRIAKEHFPLLNVYPEALFPKPTLDSGAILKEPHPPVLIIHGAQDTVIPVEHALELYEVAVGRKKILELPFSNHSNIWSDSSNSCKETLGEFVDELRH